MPKVMQTAEQQRRSRVARDIQQSEWLAQLRAMVQLSYSFNEALRKLSRERNEPVDVTAVFRCAHAIDSVRAQMRTLEAELRGGE